MNKRKIYFVSFDHCDLSPSFSAWAKEIPDEYKDDDLTDCMYDLLDEEDREDNYVFSYEKEEIQALIKTLQKVLKED